MTPTTGTFDPQVEKVLRTAQEESRRRSVGTVSVRSRIQPVQTPGVQQSDTGTSSSASSPSSNSQPMMEKGVGSPTGPSSTERTSTPSSNVSKNTPANDQAGLAEPSGNTPNTNAPGAQDDFSHMRDGLDKSREVSDEQQQQKQTKQEQGAQQQQQQTGEQTGQQQGNTTQEAANKQEQGANEEKKTEDDGAIKDALKLRKGSYSADNLLWWWDKPMAIALWIVVLILGGGSTSILGKLMSIKQGKGGAYKQIKNALSYTKKHVRIIYFQFSVLFAFILVCNVFTFLFYFVMIIIPLYTTGEVLCGTTVQATISNYLFSGICK